MVLCVRRRSGFIIGIMFALVTGACSNEPSAEQRALSRLEISIGDIGTDVSSVHDQLDGVSGRLDAVSGRLDVATDERTALLATIDALSVRIDALEARQRALLTDAVEAEIARACASLAEDADLVPEDAVRFNEAWAEVADPVDVVERTAACAERKLEIAQARAAVPERCQVVTNEISAEDLSSCRQIIAQSTDLAVTALPVTSGAGQGITTILDVAIPAHAGDTLDVSAFFQVTNDLGYNVGVGAHLWAIALDTAEPTWYRISPSTGDNVDRARHHMPVEMQTVYIVPNGWVEGHRIGVAFRADAHSSAGNGDLTVEPNGNLIVRLSRA